MKYPGQRPVPPHIQGGGRVSEAADITAATIVFECRARLLCLEEPRLLLLQALLDQENLRHLENTLFALYEQYLASSEVFFFSGLFY